MLIHAVAVAHGNRAIVLPGDPGAGKTTLAAGLVERGCGYLTDELVMIKPRTNRVCPFPKAFSLKEGSSSAFPSFAPKPTGPEYDRVWYLDAERLRPRSTVKKHVPIGWVILLRYAAGATAHTESLTVGETVLGLFENTVNIARHREAGLDRLIAIAQKAPGYRLVSGDLEEACEAVLGIVEGDGPSCS